jgi:hypothetical protein
MLARFVRNWNIPELNQPTLRFFSRHQPVRLLAIWFSKQKLQEPGLWTSEDMIEAIAAIGNDAAFKLLQTMFSQWIQRVTWVSQHKGEDCNK